MTRLEANVVEVTPERNRRRSEKSQKAEARIPFIKAEIRKGEKKIREFNSEIDRLEENGSAIGAQLLAEKRIMLKRWRDSWEYHTKELAEAKRQMRA